MQPWYAQHMLWVLLLENYIASEMHQIYVLGSRHLYLRLNCGLTEADQQSNAKQLSDKHKACAVYRAAMHMLT